MKFEIKGKTEEGRWILWNYYTCDSIFDLRNKMSHILSISQYIGIDATRID